MTLHGACLAPCASEWELLPVVCGDGMALYWARHAMMPCALE